MSKPSALIAALLAEEEEELLRRAQRPHTNVTQSEPQLDAFQTNAFQNDTFQ